MNPLRSFEDDDAIRTLVSDVLTELGYAMLSAKTGEEALTLLWVYWAIGNAKAA